MHGRDSSYLLMGTGLIMLGLLLIVGLSMRAQPEAVSGTHLLAVSGQTPMYPDKTITPGARNPAITQATIGQTMCNKNWSTKSIRDTQSTAAQKAKQYAAYHLAKPSNNSGQQQTCELDHLISLELGGADSLNNIWPECGPSDVALNLRYFKEKDAVENYLHAQVCDGGMTLATAQQKITSDWYAVFVSMHKSSPGTLGSVVAFEASDPDDN